MTRSDAFSGEPASCGARRRPLQTPFARRWLRATRAALVVSTLFVAAPPRAGAAAQADLLPANVALVSEPAELPALLNSLERLQIELLLRVAGHHHEGTLAAQSHDAHHAAVDHGAHMGGHHEVALPSSPTAFESEVLASLMAILGAGVPGAAPTDRQAVTPALRRVVDLLRRTHALHRRAYQIYLEVPASGRAAAVDDAVDAYLAGGGDVLPDVPKSMDLLHGHEHATSFQSAHPYLNGVLWASHWLRYAALEPLILFENAEGRRAGTLTTVHRFREKLGAAPNRLPTELPMAPSIAPELVFRHPRLAAILDNMNMLLQVTADVLSHHSGTADADAAIAAALATFTDPYSNVATEYQWMLMALRLGIYDQGGPALGTMERSERNQHAHGIHTGHTTVMPGVMVAP